MNCEICALDASVDSALWTCAGCPRKFHAACIGVTVHRSSMRRKDKKVVDFSSYVLPCCDSCQELLQAKLDFNRLIEQQKLLTEQLHANTEVAHRSNLQQDKQSMVNEAFEGLEILMTTIKNELATINKTSSLAGCVVAIKNHITTLLDTVTKMTNDNISKSFESVSSNLATELKLISDGICQINQLHLDMAATTAMSSNPNLGIDILDELKTWSAEIIAPRSTEPSTSSHGSSSSLNRENDADNSGWRCLGTRKVWRADWSDYDARKLVRLNQQKQAAKARRRRKQKVNRNNTADNGMRHHPSDSRNRNNAGRLDGDFMAAGGHSFLPPDRVLLAAAKERFSRPPQCSSSKTPAAQRPIQFQRGEILNPSRTCVENQQPTHGRHSHRISSGCEACYAQHSCFRNNRRTP